MNGDGYYLPDAAITASSLHPSCHGAHSTRYMESDGAEAWLTGL